MDPRILVFLPTYQERDNLEPLVAELLALRDDLGVLVVDDRSPDGTGEVADELAKQYPGRVFVMHRPPPRGRGLAGRDGLRAAAQSQAEFVAEMDADRSHRPEDLPRLLKAAENADVVLGSRYMQGGEVEGFGLRRQANSATAGWLSRVILGLHYTDPTSGYRVFRREALARVPFENLISEGPSIVGEILLSLQLRNFRIVEVPITFLERQVGESKITFKLILRWIWNLLRIRWRASKWLSP